jgi:hypothetical protein
MYSRREILAGAIGAAGAAALARPFRTALASAPEPRTPVNFKVPAGACDCHTHIFDPGEFPYAASRPYTPETASIADVRALHRALHIDRVVISQPTVYGTDHTCTLNAIKQLGRSARGVAAFAPDTSTHELDRLHRGGMRGLVVHKMSDFKDAAAQIGDRPWNIETYVRLPQMEAFRDQVMASKVTVKLTLFGGAGLASQRQGLCGTLDAVPHIEPGSRLSGRRAHPQGSHCGQSAADHLGQRLAACGNSTRSSDDGSGAVRTD